MMRSLSNVDLAAAAVYAVGGVEARNGSGMIVVIGGNDIGFFVASGGNGGNVTG